MDSAIEHQIETKRIKDVRWLKGFGVMELEPYTEDLFIKKRNRKRNKKAKTSLRIPRKREGRG